MGTGLLAFLSAPVVFAAEVVQWSPLLAAATVLTPLGVLFIAKPTIGAAMFAARPSWWAVAGAVLLLAVSFALEPHWITGWRAALATQREVHAHVYPYIAPVTQPGVVLALACLLRWRRPEARMVAVLACVPQTPMMYEIVPLMLVPRTTGEAGLLFGLSYVAMMIVAVEATPWPWRIALLLLYLPATLMVLRRPNEGPVPAWLERRIVRWPLSLRGARVRQTAEG